MKAHTLALVAALTLSALPGFAQTHDESGFYPAPYQQQALEILRRSVALRTAVGHQLVPTMANNLADLFVQAGFAADDIHVLPLTLPGGEKTASLVVRYRGDGSLHKAPILLVAHMDIVDALPEDWERDPFTLIEENGYLFGRGSFDNKFGSTMIAATLLRLKAEGFVPGRDLILAFSGDEETNMLTTMALVTEHRTLTDAEFALNSDAGEGVLDADNRAVLYQLQTSEKSFATFEITARNPGGHSSRPRPDNAIYDLAQALKKLQAFQFPVLYNDTTRSYFELSAAVTPGAEGEAMARFARDPADAEAAAVLSRQAELVGVLRTTCVATMLNAGHAENALPQSATATVNCRVFPGESIESVQSTLGSVVANPTLAIRVLDNPKASPASPLRADVLAAVTKAVYSLHPGIPIIPFQASYATDGKELRIAGIPTYGTSGLFIQPDDIFAHGLNERVPVRSFYQALEYWYVLLHELAAAR